ncbi:hypothetical protein BT63DRAFT_480335, partial [Microthyrium microscopicum]
MSNRWPPLNSNPGAPSVPGSASIQQLMREQRLREDLKAAAPWIFLLLIGGMLWLQALLIKTLFDLFNAYIGLVLLTIFYASRYYTREIHGRPVNERPDRPPFFSRTMMLQLAIDFAIYSWPPAVPSTCSPIMIVHLSLAKQFLDYIVPMSICLWPLPTFVDKRWAWFKIGLFG